jgi:hypothetical protein
VAVRNYSPADAATDLRRYQALRRTVSLQSLLLVLFAAAFVSARSPLGALSLVLGGLCGVLNMLIVMYGTQRLVQRRNIGAFVISSFLRLGVFAIVPIGLALGGKWWTLVIYFAGFFVPLALYLFSVQRFFKRK